MGEGETTEPALSLSIPELKKALLSKLYTNIYIKGACPKTRNGNSDKCPRYDPRLINSYMCSFDPITEENIKKDWDMNEEKRYLSSIIPFPKVTKKNDELTYEWIHMCLRPSNRYFEKSDTMISLIDFLNEYTQTPGEPEEGYPLTNAQDLTRYLKTDVPKINKTDVKNLNGDGTTTTYTNNYNCYAQPAPIMVCALYTICNSDNFGKMGEKYDDTNGMVQRELIDYDEKNKSKLFERWKLIYESLYSGSCSGDPAANVCLASSSENTEKIATNDDNKCKETAGENVKYLIGDGSSETPYYTNSGFMGKWNGTTDKDGVIIESFITSITDSGSLDEGILVKDGYEFSDDNTKKAMEEYNKQGEEYAKNITSIPRYQALEDYVPNYLKDPMGVGLFMGLVDEGYFAPEDLIYEGPREDKASEIDPEYKSLSNDIRIMASESEKRSTMETVLVVFIIIIFVLLVIFFIFYLARTGNLSKLAKAGVENMNSDAQYDQNSEYSE